MALETVSKFQTTGELLQVNNVTPERTLDIRLTIHPSPSGGLSELDLKAIKDGILGSLIEPLRLRIDALRRADPDGHIGLLVHVDGVSSHDSPATTERLDDALNQVFEQAGLLSHGVVLLKDWGTQSAFALTVLSELATPRLGCLVAARHARRSPNE